MTDLDYMDDAYCWETEATVTGIETREDGKTVLFLDHTIFYPQGGGQPYDLGLIYQPGSDFRVEEVRFTPDGRVHHIGFLLNGALPAVDSKVSLKIDGERRELHNKLHTAGHLVDAAMYNCGFRFEPAKGYHFPDSPYVEYVGVIEADDRPAAIEKLNAELARLIALDEAVLHRVVNDKEALKEDCLFIPDYLPEGKPIRVVTVAGFGCPCGGTHVKSNGVLQGMSIKKIKSKKGQTRISYSLNHE